MTKYIDLTLPYDERVAGYGWETARRLDTDGWNARTLHLYSHAGTHMDAPVHFGVGTQTIDQFDPADFFIERAWVVNRAGCAASALLEVADLGAVEGQLQAGDALLIRTDWSLKLGTDEYRNGVPRISDELARWCVSRGVKLLGVEGPSVADVNNLDEVTRIHQLLLGHVIIVEGLCHLDQLTQPTVRLVALPLRVAGGDGAPCRVIALEDH